MTREKAITAIAECYMDSMTLFIEKAHALRGPLTSPEAEECVALCMAQTSMRLFVHTFGRMAALMPTDLKGQAVVVAQQWLSLQEQIARRQEEKQGCPPPLT